MVLSKPQNVQNDLQSGFLSCQNYIHTLLNVTFNRNDLLDWFQGLCGHLTTIIGLIGTYYKQTRDKAAPTQNTILLYLTQVLTSLSLLINTFVLEEEIGLVLTEARKCVIKQISCCLESIEVSLSCTPAVTDPSGNFVRWMDAALERVSEITLHNGKTKALETYTETRQIFEEVLSHAMSIAQVSLPQDSKIIRGSCQTVLNTLASLQTELDNPTTNPSMVHLFVDACSHKLCHLEKKVNTAVLKLCLKTFSQFTTPLEKIRHFCFEGEKRVGDELDSLVADFDLHVDRIMQIGLFAVSCSSDCARGVKIRSCLASLEALESELVPSLTAVLLEKSPHNRNCAEILMRHWLDQAVALQKLIFLIIDPFAFSQVIYEEAAEIVDVLSSTIRKSSMIEQRDVVSLLVVTKVLQSFLSQSQSEFSDNEANKVKTKLKDYNEVLEEVETASKLLLSGDNNDPENSKRVLKRCKILLIVLKRIWVCFADDVFEKNKSQVVEKPVLELPSIDSLQLQPTGNPFLDHIINRGKQILQERSVLYRTPIKKKTGSAKAMKSQQIPLSKLVHLRKLSFVNITSNEPSLDLQITDILNEMTTLSTSLKPNTTKTI
ncbi:hypothetical protein Zmor_027599 [Zophobas morio]|uniref:Serendipity locus protein alpha n=1 Tax=Zophobas morio TaxID=2755281 RepID=A0AA38M245_9CUCU|nr:hypothetical protein Zmor_027599 [Zophobas morio]